MRMVLFFLLLALANVASAKTPYQMRDVVLLQPDAVLQERIMPSALAPYIRSVNAVAGEVLAGEHHEPAGGFLVLAIRPGNQSAAWLDIQPDLPPGLAQVLVSRLRAIPPPAVENGTVIFAIRAGLWGGTPSAEDMPAVKEWTEAAVTAGAPLPIDELVERAWPR